MTELESLSPWLDFRRSEWHHRRRDWFALGVTCFFFCRSWPIFILGFISEQHWEYLVGSVLIWGSYRIEFSSSSFITRRHTRSHRSDEVLSFLGMSAVCLFLICCVESTLLIRTFALRRHAYGMALARHSLFLFFYFRLFSGRVNISWFPPYEPLPRGEPRADNGGTWSCHQSVSCVTSSLFPVWPSASYVSFSAKIKENENWKAAAAPTDRSPSFHAFHSTTPLVFLAFAFFFSVLLFV